MSAMTTALDLNDLRRRHQDGQERLLVATVRAELAIAADRPCTCGHSRGEHDFFGECGGLVADPAGRAYAVGCPCGGFTATTTNESEDGDDQD